MPHQLAGGLVQVPPKTRGEEGVQNMNRHPRLAHTDPAQFIGVHAGHHMGRGAQHPLTQDPTRR